MKPYTRKTGVSETVKVSQPVTPAPEPTELHLFITPHTNFAAWAIATARLPYRGARRGRYGIDFMLDDPDNKGMEFLIAFRNREAEKVEALSLLEAWGFLKGEMRRIQQAGAGVDNDK
jgi:hypothetical protein